MNEGLGSWLNPLSGSLGSGATNAYSEVNNLITSTGDKLVTDDGTEIIYAQ